MTNNIRPPIIWGILLAAGQGRRFAQARPGQDKLLQPLPHGLSVLQTSTQALAQHCAFTLVITLPEHHQRHEQVHLMAQNQNTVELFSSAAGHAGMGASRSEEHTSELQSRFDLVCRLLLEKKK